MHVEIFLNSHQEKVLHVDLGFFQNGYFSKCGFSHVNMGFFSQHGILKKSQVNMEHLFLMRVQDRSESGETPAMTSEVGGNHLPELLSGPCR
jgi:hypothetical protein